MGVRPMQANVDLRVDILSSALADKAFDLIICGSIGACESVRFIRQLRRIGARIQPWLTYSGSQFITETSVSWAAGEKAITHLDGRAFHIATKDALIIAPASANFLSKLALGIADTPSLTLALSYLGTKKPIIVVANMQESLFLAPTLQKNLQSLAPFVTFLDARHEEQKLKFPEPHILADQIAHVINRPLRPDKPVLVTMGSTRGYIDDVRFVTNASTGSLGSEICHELYRRGFETIVACGSARVEPLVYSEKRLTYTNGEMLEFCLEKSRLGLYAGIFVAAVLDFIPSTTAKGKISSDQAQLHIEMKRSEKIISKLNQFIGPKIGFKLGSNLTQIEMDQLASTYLDRYQLDLIVVNDIKQLSPTDHPARIYRRNGDIQVSSCVNRREIAASIVAFIEQF